MLALPEGYAAQEAEGGRLAIYDSYTGMWLGELDPYLSSAQEVVQELIASYEDERERREGPNSARLRDCRRR